MKPGTNHIVWAVSAFAITGAAVVLAARFRGADPAFGSSHATVFWMFVGAGAVVGLTGIYLLLIGIRERGQYQRARASISTTPEHRPGSRSELILRILATLAASDGTLSDDKAEVLRQVLSQMDRTGYAPAPLSDLLRGQVSGDVASEILASEHMLDAAAVDFVLTSCFLLLEAMDDPGPVQEELMVRIAAAMGLSELELTAHMHRFERSDGDLAPLGTADR